MINFIKKSSQVKNWTTLLKQFCCNKRSSFNKAVWTWFICWSVFSKFQRNGLVNYTTKKESKSAPSNEACVTSPMSLIPGRWQSEKSKTPVTHFIPSKLSGQTECPVITYNKANVYIHNNEKVTTWSDEVTIVSNFKTNIQIHHYWNYAPKPIL